MHRALLLLTTFLAASCGQSQQTIELHYVATINGQSAGCGDTIPSVSDLRFFVSEVSVYSEKTEVFVPATFVGASPWQTDRVTLVDLENGQGSCNNGTSETNDVVRLQVPDGLLPGRLRFTVGVPFELNHANPLTAEAPLNDSAMHWHWRSGYKFLRAGLTDAHGETWIHLGSTGCEGTVGAISGCSAPNRVVVELSTFDPAVDRIAVNLSALLNAAGMLESGDRLDCSSGPAEVSCELPFAVLGIPFGNASTPDTQQVFSVLR